MPKRLFYDNLEALRGVAALIVLWGHTTVQHGWLDPAYYLKGIWSYTGPAHLGVLVFFTLSGYVIGLNYAAPLNRTTVSVYLKKRFVRVYPIYLICLLLGLDVTKEYYSEATIWSHFVLSQGLTSPVITAIGPSWSLAYEALFYVLFIPVSAFRINPVLAALFVIVIGSVDAYFYPIYGFSLLPSYAFGFSFWLCGLSLARYLPRERVANHAYMTSLLFLLLAIGKLDAPVNILHKVGLYIIGKDLSYLSINKLCAITFSDFGYLPYCLLIIAVFTGRKFPCQRLSMAVLLAIPAITYYVYYTRFDIEDWYALVFPSVFYSFSILIFLFHNKVINVCKYLIERIIMMGSISYGLYIIHYPVLYVFGHNNIVSGSLSTFLLRLIAFLVIVFAGAYVLERKFQPWIKTRLL